MKKVYVSIILCSLIFVFNACENQIMQKLLDPLVAHDGAVIYTITFNANGGKGTIEPIKVKAGECINLPKGEGFTREDYTFRRWSKKNADGKKEYFRAGAEYTPADSTTFYAEWRKANVTDVTDEDGEKLIDKLKWIMENAESDTTYEIILEDDETLDTFEFYFPEKSNIIIQISGNVEKLVTLSPSGGPLFTIGKGVTLELSEVTLKGKEGNNASLVCVDGGELVINDGVVITGNNINKLNGGGVYVANDGIFTMNGGKISGNNAGLGGAVYVYDGTFTMNGGEISENTAQSGGGVYVEHDGEFTMESGTISGNTANANGGGVANDGTFTMESGTISGNNAQFGGGVDNYDAGEFTMKDGTISGNIATGNGGGVDNGGIFIMESGIISGNMAYGNGGGVYNDGNLTMNGGTISGNTATGNGGGVYVAGREDSDIPGSIFTVGGTAKVFGNTGDSGQNNVFLDWERYITLGEDEENTPKEGMKIHVKTANQDGGLVVWMDDAGDDSLWEYFMELCNYFTADGGGEVYPNDNGLWLSYEY